MRKLLVVAIASAALVALTAPSAMAGGKHGGGHSGGHWSGHSGRNWGGHSGGHSGRNWGGHSGGHWRGGHWAGHWRGGHWGGGHWGGHWHGHRPYWYGGYWGPSIAFGVTPYYWPYTYSPGVVYSEPPAVYSEPPVAYSSAAETAPAPAVEREVVYPHGRYVLHGDGVNTPYRWVWVPNQ